MKKTDFIKLLLDETISSEEKKKAVEQKIGAEENFSSEEMAIIWRLNIPGLYQRLIDYIMPLEPLIVPM